MNDEAAFTKLIVDIKDRHSSVYALIPRGVKELQHELQKCVFIMLSWQSLNFFRSGKCSDEVIFAPELQNYLDSFFMSRIGMRMILGMFLFKLPLCT
jgi:hypothetical protein